MNGVAGLAIVLAVLFLGPRMITAIFSAAFKKRRQVARAKLADTLWGYFAFTAAVVLIGLAGLDYLGLIDIT